jgi:hypothetical protein
MRLQEADVLARPLGHSPPGGLHLDQALGYRSIPADEVENTDVIQILALERYIFTHPVFGTDAVSGQTCDRRITRRQSQPIKADQGWA